MAGWVLTSSGVGGVVLGSGYWQAAEVPTSSVPQPQPAPLPKAYDQRSLFEPAKLVREARRQLGLPEGQMPTVVVLDPDGDLLARLRSDRRVEPVASWPCYHSKMWAATIAGLRVGVIPYVVGGPYAVLVAEQAFASGCRFLIDLTSAGRVTELQQRPPYFVVVQQAWRDEGTSVHYLPPAAWVDLDPAVRAALQDLPHQVGGQPVFCGASWTTDAPYRETPDALAAARGQQILAVEMEAASLYAFAARSGVPVLCLAHITNDISVAEDTDFNKGEHGGAVAAIRLIEYVLRSLSNTLNLA